MNNLSRSSEAHAQYVSQLFGKIVPLYDALNTIFSFGQDTLWRKALTRSIRTQASNPGSVIADVAAGTLKVTAELVRAYPHARVLALDFCRPMLAKGLVSLPKETVSHISPCLSDALSLPLRDESVDAITMAFGLRNMRPRAQALAEAFRVLKPGGKLSVLELGSTKDRILFGVYNLYLEKIMPPLAKLFSSNKGAYHYLAESISRYPSAEEMRQEMLAIGFQQVEYSRMTAGIVYLHQGVK